MSVFTVLQPEGESSEIKSADRTIFLKDGFCWPAFVFGPFWLAYRRVWIGLGVWFVLIVALALVARFAGIDPRSVSWGSFAVGLLLALEGNVWRERALIRRSFRVVDLVAARNRDEAERIFFHRSEDASASIGAATAASRYRSVEPVILGLFPEPERGR